MVQKKTPFEIWIGEKPLVGHIHVFGCNAYLHVPMALRIKVDAENNKVIFMNYNSTSKAYCIWSCDKKCIEESQDVYIDFQ